MLKQSVVESDEPLKLAIAGSGNAPGLTRLSRGAERQIDQVNLSENEAREAVRRGSIQVVLLVPKDYPRLVRLRGTGAGLVDRRQLRLADTQALPTARAACWQPTAAPSRSCGCRSAASIR
jgi:hypothetical protein